MVTRKNGIATHQLSSVTLDDKGDEREEENDPTPTEKAQPESAAPIFCRLCQNTLNEQEVSRTLRGSTAEPVLCDACLHPVAQAPQSTGKRKRASHPQSEPSAKRVRLKTTTDNADGLEILKQSLSFEMNEQENRATRQLFETLKRTNIRIKQTLYKAAGQSGSKRTAHILRQGLCVL